MKRLLLFLLFLALPIVRADDVLFIGNSFVYTNKMPEMLETIASSKGRSASVKAITRGGQGWAYHLYQNAEATEATLKSKPWNFVIIQDYSTNATHLNPKADFFKNGEALYDKITATSPGASIVIYETWSFPAATADGGAGATPEDKPKDANSGSEADQPADAGGKARSTGEVAPKPFRTEAEMFGEIHKNYGLLFEQLKARDPKREVVLAPVGSAFAICRKAHPEINLFGNDRKHPSMAGSYLIACVFYTIIYNDSPAGASKAGNLPIKAEVAQTLEEVAAAAILNR